MIVKKREIPIKILVLEAILRRLHEHHPKRTIIEEDLSKYKAGYQGEKALNYYLSFLDEQKYSIFHDLRLCNGEYYFQIDSLILSTDFALIVEVKNITGTLLFEPNFNQLIRSIDEKEEGFPNPLLQIQRQQLQLRKWLDKKRLIHLPIEILIINSNSSAILKGNQYVSKYVCKIDRLLEKIATLEKKYIVEILNPQEMRKLSKSILKYHSPFETQSFLQKYSIPSSDIITGVQCPQCKTFPMKYYRRKWYCPRCQTISKVEHIKATQDYFYLIKNTMSNADFRHFLHIHSISSASKLLESMDLKKTGEKKGRLYQAR
ncbi:nuclease-related domain-containing protein [Cytobacillus dafuensis]|uniref:NERD domain-containing protein n=1 Tax=Cytobacillus dafuensis TaxID=1742359 RepID=A0A5B8Z1F9_CYTDA|nr:nuclease-related domain-containing protein [Cytobacillus dafuensis]QED46651.1 NERD domain-containing protein [Cytobacillus dafuensis]